MMEITKDVEAHFEFCLEMECAAAEPYLRFVYEDYEQALAVQRFLGGKGLLESSRPHGRVLLDNGEPIAMASGMPGAELVRLRMKAAFALQKSDRFRPDDATRKRIQLARETLLSPHDTDYYCGKLGVSPRARSKGAGEIMMKHLTEEGIALGFQRAVGEIQEGNKAIVRVTCDKLGWQRLCTRRVEDPETGRSLEYVHIFCDCTPK